MTLLWHRFRNTAFSVFDQAWLSALSLLIAFIFIRVLDKSDYALYVLLSNSVLLFHGIGGAVLTAPYTTVQPQQLEEHRILAEVVFCRLTVLYCLLASAVAFCGYAIYSTIENQYPDMATSLALACCVTGAIFRENIRTLFYARGNPHAALKNNVGYGLLLTAGLALLLVNEQFSTTAVLFLLGVSGIAVSMILLKTALNSPAIQAQASQAHRLKVELWKCGRWAIVGSLVTFVTLNSYPYITAVTYDQSRVADISAARLLSVPILLLGTAWSNMMRPALSRWHAQERHEEISIAVRRASALFGIGSIVTGIVLYGSNDLLSAVLGDKYAHLQGLALWWSLYAGAACIKGVHAATLMVNGQGYRTLSRISVITLVVMVLLMLVAARAGIPESIVIVLAILEFLQIWLIRRENASQEYQKCPASI